MFEDNVKKSIEKEKSIIIDQFSNILDRSMNNLLMENLYETPQNDTIHYGEYEKLSDHAKRYGVSYNTILKWHSEGRLKGSIRMGGDNGTILVPKDCIFRSSDKTDDDMNISFPIEKNHNTPFFDLSWELPVRKDMKSFNDIVSGDFQKDFHTVITSGQRGNVLGEDSLNNMHVIDSIIKQILSHNDSVDVDIIDCFDTSSPDSRNFSEKYKEIFDKYTYEKDDVNYVPVSLEDRFSSLIDYINEISQKIVERRELSYQINNDINGIVIDNFCDSTMYENLNTLRENISRVFSVSPHIIVIPEIYLFSHSLNFFEILRNKDIYTEFIKIIREARSQGIFVLGSSSIVYSASTHDPSLVQQLTEYNLLKDKIDVDSIVM